ncbi:MAG: class I SAM-dependent methyltransferase [Anaerolineales bacterium]|nr:class I SAM-dependent methyltransferase [Anaerolineales bacterium]
MDEKQTFFDFAAEVGLTKHLGGVAATELLVDLCRINQDSYVLDVGCGAGVTACFLASKTGCKVMGIDIHPGMVEKSRQRVEREQLVDQVEFRVADVQKLPFSDDTFDAVISESVTAFPKDKALAVREYVRVTKPGGYIGLNESTWLKYPPTQAMIEWVSQDVGATVEPLQSHQWQELLSNAGLTDLVSNVSCVDVKEESMGIMQRYGCGGLLRILGRAFRLYLSNPEYRNFVKRTQQQGVVPDAITEYFGYGLYVGKKV